MLRSTSSIRIEECEELEEGEAQGGRAQSYFGQQSFGHRGKAHGAAKLASRESGEGDGDGDGFGDVWNIDGSSGDYQNWRSFCLVQWAQIIYTISLVIIIPTASDYARQLGETSTAFFGVVIGISSIIDPLTSSIWSRVISATNLKTVLTINALINLFCATLYICASPLHSATLLIVSRCILGFGSCQTAVLTYLSCAVSRKKMSFSHYLTTAILAYGFACGIALAFCLSLVAHYANWDQNTAPGFFTAFLWLTYLPVHHFCFVEPNKQAGIIDPDSHILLTESMRPTIWLEPFAGLVPCFVGVITVAMISGAFEVLTIQLTSDLWEWNIMQSSLYLGGIMLVVALTTLLSYILERSFNEGSLMLGAFAGASILVTFYYIPVTSTYHDRMVTTAGMVGYSVTSILVLSALNLGRTIAFTLITKLPSPMWRSIFLGMSAKCFNMGRGIGPVLAGALKEKDTLVTVLYTACILSTLCVSLSLYKGKLELKEEHETGPAVAEKIVKGADWKKTERLMSGDEWSTKL